MTPAELKALRAELGLTQADLAKRLMVSVTTISRWECGRHAISENMAEYIVLEMRLQFDNHRNT